MSTHSGHLNVNESILILCVVWIVRLEGGMRLRPQSLLVLILIGSGTGAGCTPSSKTETETNSRLVRHLIAETDARNFSAYDELLSSEMTQHSPGGLDLDRAEFEAAEREFAEAFPDASRKVDLLLSQGDKVMIRETFRGTHSGAFQDIPATGSSVEFTANAIYRIENGKIAESWVEGDFGNFVASLRRDSPRDNAHVADAASEVEARFKAWSDAEVQGDIEAVKAFYADDVVVQPANAPPVYGKAAAIEVVEELLQTPLAVMQPQSARVVVSRCGDLAAIFGDLKVVYANPDGEQEVPTKFAAVWRKDATGWHVVLNSWSTNE